MQSIVPRQALYHVLTSSGPLLVCAACLPSLGRLGHEIVALRLADGAPQGGCQRCHGRRRPDWLPPGTVN